MALADYVDRAALAAAQALRAVDVTEFAQRLERAPIEIVFGRTALESHEGRSALDLAVRLLARLYPVVEFRGPGGVVTSELEQLARRINPRIGSSSEAPAFSLVVGEDAASPRGEPVFVGSGGWTALLSTRSARPVGASAIPTGAGVAVCLGTGRIFRRLFATAAVHENDVRLNILETLAPGATFNGTAVDFGTAVLVGAGAIGEVVLWSLYRSPIEGRLHVVDHEPLDLSNLQRYVLAERNEVEQMKVAIARIRAEGSALEVIPHEQRWEEFMVGSGTAWDRVLVALDTVEGRREVQGTLPKWLGNSWTQIGDLGVSTHTFGAGPCVWCLYLSDGEVPSEDRIVAEGLRLPYEEVKMQVRELLYTGAPVPDELLARIGATRGVDDTSLEPFRGQSLRKLYRRGICGGGLIPIEADGTIARDMQVPLAHQSALAGIVLAAALLIDAAGISRRTTEVFRMDVMRPLGSSQIIRPLARDAGRRCICRDIDYLETYGGKYGDMRASSS